MKKSILSHRGSVTLFLCLTLTLMCSLIMLTLEHARIAAVKSHVEGVSHFSLESAMGYFSLPLFETYGLFGVSMSDNHFNTVIKENLKENISLQTLPFAAGSTLFPIDSFKLSTNTIYHMTDKNGSIFLDQISDYMSYQIVPDLLLCLSNADVFESIGKNPVDLSAIDLENETYLDMNYPLSDFSEDMCKEDELPEEDAAKELKKGILSSIQSLIKSISLSVYLTDGLQASAAYTDTSVLSSHTCSYRNKKDCFKSTTEKLTYLCYLSQHFNCFTSQKQKDGMQYEQEYMLYGKSKDSENLSAFIHDLQTLRTGLNLAYLYTDKEKRMQARSIASASTLLLEIPFLTEFVEFALLSAWSYAEAVVDIRGLLAGNKIPLIKTSSSWRLDLSELIDFSPNVTHPGSDYGFTYEQYLLLYFYQKADTATIYRTMDMIENRIAMTQKDFSLSSCITGIDAQFQYTFRPVFSSFPNIYRHSTVFGHTFSQVYGF